MKLNHMNFRQAKKHIKRSYLDHVFYRRNILTESNKPYLVRDVRGRFDWGVFARHIWVKGAGTRSHSVCCRI